MTELLVRNIAELATAPHDAELPLRGNGLAKLTRTRDAAVLIRNGVIVSCGEESQVAAHATSDARVLDAGGCLATPGLVDCHAHPVFAGTRAGEFELRNLGAGYEQIHAAGGGIRATVQATREALQSGTLLDPVRRHLDWMLAAGTTTAEAKSGYALTEAGELESLHTAIAAGAGHVVDVVPTLLAAHTVPSEYGEDADAYLDEVAIPALRRAAEEGVARSADVFVERGSFGREQAARYLCEAQRTGLLARMHAEQFSDQGAIELAVVLGARSVDHLEALAPDAPRLAQLADSSTAAVLLPLSSLFLRRPFAPGRSLVDAGAIVAVASDFNPGSSYGESLTLAITLACTGCGLRAAEALNAVTANAAWVLDRHRAGTARPPVGRIAPGHAGDLVLFEQPDIEHLAYHAGSPALRCVVKHGEVVWRSGGAAASPVTIS